MMQTSNRGGIRGLGAGISYLGGAVGSGISQGIQNYGRISNAGDLWKASKAGVSGMFKGTAGTSLGLGAAGAVLSGIAGPKSEYSGERGDTTKALDSVYDGVSTALNFIPGWGQVASGFMQLNKGVSSLVNKWGGGTDAMTDVDAVLGSNFFSMTPVGLINGFGGKRAETMEGKDFMTQSKLNNVWSGYTGTYSDYQSALEKEGKKYGAFSSGARKRANRLIRKANMDRANLLAMDMDREIGNIKGINMANIRGAAYEQSLFGGINPNRVRLGKYGVKLQDIQRAHRLTSKYQKQINSPIKEKISTEEKSTIEQFKEGGQMNVIPEGALHARKNNMEGAGEDFTSKGIPVVDNDGNQQAEIELNEIIFRKEVTDKLEELAKDGSDEAAIEAGKLLTEEILHNTDDRTGLIDTIEIAKNGTKLIPKAESGISITPYDIQSLNSKLDAFNKTQQQEQIDLYNQKANNYGNFLLSLTQSAGQGINDIATANQKLETEKRKKQALQANYLDSLKVEEAKQTFWKNLLAAKEQSDEMQRRQLYGIG